MTAYDLNMVIGFSGFGLSVSYACEHKLLAAVQAVVQMRLLRNPHRRRPLQNCPEKPVLLCGFVGLR